MEEHETVDDSGEKGDQLQSSPQVEVQENTPTQESEVKIKLEEEVATPEGTEQVQEQPTPETAAPRHEEEFVVVSLPEDQPVQSEGM